MRKPSIFLTVSLACFAAGLNLLQAGTSNALDSIYFGNIASETAHNFDPGFTSLPLTGIGALGQTYRAPYGIDGMDDGSAVIFTMTCNATLQNYLSIRLYGGDNSAVFTILNGTEETAYSPMDSGANGGGIPFPNRFYYATIPIPLSMTQGKTSVELFLYQNGGTGGPNRPIYSAYTHTDPHFSPSGSDPTGTQEPLTGQLAFTTLSTSQIISLLQTERQAVYGSGGYYNQILARQIPAGTTGAPPEVIGLDFYAAVNNSYYYYTPDQWRDQCGGSGHGPGYSTVPDEMLTVLTSTFFLPPFTDVNGNVVSGLDHYHDATIIPRIVSCLDGTSYLQSSDGHYQAQPEPCWNGVTSTARATGHYYAGSTSRSSGYGLSLEGGDTDCLGRTILKLLSDPTSAPIFESYLTQSYDADLTGGSMMRAYAYERMLNNQIYFLAGLAGAPVISQGLLNIQGWYTNIVALNKLQALYPYPTTTSTFPNDSYNYPINYPSASSATAVYDLEQMMGVIPGTFYGLYASGLTNYAISSDGLGEAHGVLSGGYDGRYGEILPFIGCAMIPTAALDPNISPTVLAQLQSQAKAAVDGFEHFISTEENFQGDVNYFTLAQEDYITYRDPYGPNADSLYFLVGQSYFASDPSVGINSALQRKGDYLEALNGKTPGVGKGGGDQLCYLYLYASYEASLRGLINVDPSTLASLPGEPGQPNSAFVDPQTGTSAIYFNGERMYMNSNWRSYETASPQGFGTNSFLSRIHDTTSTIDHIACVFMPHDSTTVQSDGNLTGTPGQPFVMHWGNWLLAGNQTSNSSTVSLPAGNGLALDLVSGTKYNMGSTITIPAGGTVAVNMPIPTITQTIGNGTYTMTNLSSSLLLNCPGGASTSGLQIVQAASSSSTSSQWTFTYTSNGCYTIKNAASGLFLADLNGSTSSGVALVQEPADSATDQSWQAIQSGDGYVFVNQAGGLVINDPAANATAGTGMVIASQDAATDSVWHLTANASGPSAAIPNGTYVMTLYYDGNILDDLYSTQFPGNQPVQNTANFGVTQQWVFTYNGSGFYTIKNVGSGHYLAFNNYGLSLVAADNQADQLFQLFPDDFGYILVNQGPYNWAIDCLSGFSVGNGVGLNPYGGGGTQIWFVELAPPTNLVATPGDGQVSLTWNALSTATSYNVKRGTPSGGPYTTVASGLTSTTYTDTGLTDGTTYYYVVSAATTGAETNNSAGVSATPSSAFQKWEASYGLSGQATTATPDGDGVALLLKYATGMVPGTPSAYGPASLSNSGGFLTLQFNRLSPAPYQYVVEASTTLASTSWTTIASIAAGSDTWTGTATVSEGTGTTRAVTVTDTVAIGTGTERFLRLRVVGVNGTVAQGYFALSIPGGAAQTLSLPLDQPPVARGTVSALTSSSVTVAAAGNWATTTAPYAVRMVSGNGSGAVFPISAISGNVLSLTTQGVDLTQLIAAGDSYTVFPLDTLGNLFGVNGGPFLTGSTAATADNLLLWNGTGWTTYYNTGTSWKQSGSLLAQNNVILAPDAGLFILRHGTATAAFTLQGRIHETAPRQFMTPGGSTLLSVAHPISSLLSASGFTAASGWQSGFSATSADDLNLWTGTAWQTYYYNGSSWRRSGSLSNQNSTALTPGQAIFVTRLSVPATSQSFVLQPLPYTTP